MKVRCTKLVDALGNRQVKSNWLTVDKVYHVISLGLDVHGTWYVRLLSDHEGVALFSLKQFEVVSNKLPASWVAVWHDAGAFELISPALSHAEFWDRYYEHDPATVNEFEVERRRIVTSDP